MFLSICVHFLGDLHSDVNEAVLFDKFSTTGPLISVRVCRDLLTRKSLGYAYINYQQPADAERVLDTMNFELLHGQPIRIMWSQRDPSLRRSGALYDTFSVFGNILSCKIMHTEYGKSRGFGFVHFECQESANCAIEQVNGMLLKSKRVFVGRFKSKAERKKELGGQERKFINVYIKNFADALDNNSLKNMFEPFGDIYSAKVFVDEDGKSKGFGFVSFRNPASAEQAVKELNGTEIGNRKIYVGRAVEKAERTAELKRRLDAIRNERLNDTVDDEKLKSEFASFGEITSAKVMTENGRSKGFGFVCFNSPEEATRAVTEMNGHILVSKPLYVALAQRKEERIQHLQNQLWHKMNNIRLSQTNPQHLAGATAPACTTLGHFSHGHNPQFASAGLNASNLASLGHQINLSSVVAAAAAANPQHSVGHSFSSVGIPSSLHHQQHQASMLAHSVAAQFQQNPSAAANHQFQSAVSHSLPFYGAGTNPFSPNTNIYNMTSSQNTHHLNQQQQSALNNLPTILRQNTSGRISSSNYRSGGVVTGNSAVGGNGGGGGGGNALSLSTKLHRWSTSSQQQPNLNYQQPSSNHNQHQYTDYINPNFNSVASITSAHGGATGGGHHLSQNQNKFHYDDPITAVGGSSGINALPPSNLAVGSSRHVRHQLGTSSSLSTTSSSSAVTSGSGTRDFNQSRQNSVSGSGNIGGGVGCGSTGSGASRAMIQQASSNHSISGSQGFNRTVVGSGSSNNRISGHGGSATLDKTSLQQQNLITDRQINDANEALSGRSDAATTMSSAQQHKKPTLTERSVVPNIPFACDSSSPAFNIFKLNLENKPKSEQVNLLGEHLFPYIEMFNKPMAGRLTGMLLEINLSELLSLIKNPDELNSKIHEAIHVLKAHHDIGNSPSYSSLSSHHQDQNTTAMKSTTVTNVTITDNNDTVIPSESGTLVDKVPSHSSILISSMEATAAVGDKGLSVLASSLATNPSNVITTELDVKASVSAVGAEGDMPTATADNPPSIRLNTSASSTVATDGAETTATSAGNDKTLQQQVASVD
ncbi:hypothetical protein GJ496_009124 [Pomphorhynchus laevis]|nr:hypothetical protein GJ496_009124 [Pomphorhynchus laevis]